METTEVKTAELEGAALDWAVAKATEWIEPLFGIGAVRYIEADSYLMMETPDPDEPEDITKPSHFNHYVQWSPSRIWSQSGPLVEKFNVELTFERAGLIFAELCKDDGLYHEPFSGMYGKDYLTAACRAIVAAKLGDTVQVPADLIGATA